MWNNMLLPYSFGNRLQIPPMFNNVPFANVINLLLNRIRLGGMQPVGGVYNHPLSQHMSQQTPPGYTPRVGYSGAGQQPAVMNQGIRPIDPILDAGAYLNPNTQYAQIGGQTYILDNPNVLKGMQRSGQVGFRGQTPNVNLLGGGTTQSSPSDNTGAISEPATPQADVPKDLTPGPTDTTYNPSQATALNQAVLSFLIQNLQKNLTLLAPSSR